ncbi:SpaH/EbpB family LPXTG-anchored major pilin [Leucobacter sp. PH1c]|uniref:SpaH/EbpB family LPXTG-anchored major pilin n=1 Tax=Leucobacter sp. PH1c TaxID=1397278 RepID=UPI0004693C4C|nr:SpaH/EbpB family LPXTG-anchored major pilin [Leucobacter sp. PH1c]
MKRQRGLLAGIGAAATALLLALGGATAAQAAPSTIPESGLTGSINIHKFEQPDAATEAADGLRRDTAGLTPISGVTFSVRQVQGLDLSKNAGWIAATKYSVDAATGRVAGPGGAAVTLGAAQTQVTDAAGDAVFGGLPIGLYLVQETQAPAGVTKAAPFLVTVPLTDPVNRGSWITDIHVYPKNSSVTAEKTVQDADATKVGDTVNWTITGQLPRTANADGTFAAPSGYRVVDQLDARLALAEARVSLLNGPAITAGTDYVVSTVDNTVTVDFTPAGLAKLGAAAQNPEARVQVVLSTTVVSLGDGTVGDGVIKNQAVVFPNKESFESKPGDPDGPVTTPVVESRWGDIVISKVSSKDAAKKLAGAQFQVFASEDAARQAGTAAAQPIAINGEDTFTTDADGLVRISGLHVSDFVDGKAIGDAKDFRTYWVVEVVAPEGFELLAAPIEFTVTAGGTAAEVVTVENAPHNAGFELPLTGAAGTWMFTIGGLLVIGGGVALMLRRKRADRAA